MKTYTDLRTDYGNATLDTSTANLDAGMRLMNDHIRGVCASGDFPFMRKDRTLTTVASQQGYVLNYDLETVSTVKVTVGTTIYSPSPVNSQREWDILNSSSFTSDAAEMFFVKDGTLYIWPTPATAGSTITANGRLRPVDLNVADITTTTITTLANGSKALTVSAGLTAQMAGFHIKPTFSTTANTGDGRWYEMASVTNATTAILVRSYGGVSIAAGTAACVIGQAPILPEAFHDWPVYVAAEHYWSLYGNETKANHFRQLAIDRAESFNASVRSAITNPVIDDGYGFDGSMFNPNLYPHDIG